MATNEAFKQAAQTVTAADVYTAAEWDALDSALPGSSRPAGFRKSAADIKYFNYWLKTTSLMMQGIGDSIAANQGANLTRDMTPAQMQTAFEAAIATLSPPGFEFKNDGVAVPGGPFTALNAIGGGGVANGSDIDYTPPGGGGGGGSPLKKGYFTISGGDQSITSTNDYIQWDTTTDFPVNASGHITGFEAGKSYAITVCIQGVPSSVDLTQFQIYNHTTGTALSKLTRHTPETYSANRNTGLPSITYIYTPTASDEIGVKCARLDPSNFSVEETTTSMTIVEIGSVGGSGSDLTQVVAPADADIVIESGQHVYFDLSSMTAERTATWPVGADGAKFRFTTYGRHATLGLLTNKNGGTLLNQDPIFGSLVAVGTFQFNGSSTASSGTNFTFGGGLVNCTGEVTANGVCQINLPVTYKVGSTIFGTGTFSAISSSSMNHADAVNFASSNNEHITYNRERSDGSGRLPTTPAMLFIFCPDDVGRLVNELTYECQWVPDESKWAIRLVSISKVL